jgi:cell division protein FtsW (lipid II flippase)
MTGRALIARVGSLACAIAALGLVMLASWDIYLTGFPDSHLTDYDKAADAPKRILVWVEWGFVVLFLALASLPIGARKRTVGSLVALVALVLVAIVQWFGIPWYFITHLGLDNGIGG